MKFGRMWYDADKNKSLEDKIIDASNNYYEKNGFYPNAAFVHPSMLKEQNIKLLDNIQVYTAEHIQPNNIWVGWEE